MPGFSPSRQIIYCTSDLSCLGIEVEQCLKAFYYFSYSSNTIVLFCGLFISHIKYLCAPLRKKNKGRWRNNHIFGFPATCMPLVFNQRPNETKHLSECSGNVLAPEAGHSSICGVLFTQLLSLHSPLRGPGLPVPFPWEHSAGMGRSWCLALLPLLWTLGSLSLEGGPRLGLHWPSRAWEVTEGINWPWNLHLQVLMVLGCVSFLPASRTKRRSSSHFTARGFFTWALCVCS